MKTNLQLLLFLCVLLETIAHVIGVVRWDNIQLTTIVYFVSGIFIAVIPLIKYPKVTQLATRRENTQPLNRFFYILIATFYIFLIPHIWQWASDLFVRHTIDYASDMLIIIKTMCERFLEGTYVYEILPIWDGTEPIYLPAMWLPFLPCVFLDFDIRWTSVISLLIGLFFIFFMGKRKSFKLITLLLFVPIFYLLFGLIFTDYRLISLSEESVVVCYYLFLAYSLTKRNPYLIGIAISLCLMSRFALVFWAMMYIVYVFFFQHKKDATKIGGTIAVLCTLLLLSTGAIWQIDVILGLPKIYVEHLMENEWKFNGFIKTNLGLLKFFPFSVLPIFHQSFLLISVGIPFLCFLFYWRFKHRINQPFFAICSLKLSLVFFYNFLLMPFLYLFYTSTFFSIAILSWYLKDD